MLLFCWACKTTTPTVSETPQSEKSTFPSSIGDYIDLQNEQFKRIDILIDSIFESEYQLCDFYNISHEYYIKKKELPLKALDELVMFNNMSIKNENYIYHKILRNYDYQNTENKKKWYDCLSLFPKKDCADGDFHLRMNRIPWILRDTSSLDNSFELVDYVGNILVKEKCTTNDHFLREEVEWRKNLFEASKMQLKKVEQEDIDYREDVHWIMLHLPDSLTTDYAYNYFINNELTPKEFDGIDYIINILDDRMPNLYEKNTYASYSGPDIYLKEHQIDTLLLITNQIEKENECDWCGWFLRDLKRSKSNF